MSWLAPLIRQKTKDRHRPGYFRDYYARNIEKMRAYYLKRKRKQKAEARA